MRHRLINFTAIAAGALLGLFALANSLVTVANAHSSGYRGALLFAVGSELLALTCLAVPFVRGPWPWRLAAAVLAAPALFVFSDFAQRAPFAFGGG